MSENNTTAGPRVDHESAVSHRKQLLGSVDLAPWAGRLELFMRRFAGARGDVAISSIHIPSAGGSSGTLMFTAAFDQGKGQAKRDYVLRFATPGGLFHHYDLPGQAKIQQGLKGTSVPVPGIVGVDADGTVLGVIGYVMERVNGDVPPASFWKSGLLFDASPENRRRMIFDVIASLAKLHALDWRTLGIEFLLNKGNGNTAIERTIDWFWASLRWGCPNEVEQLEPIRQWLLAHQPPEDYVCLNHGDAMVANYMFRDQRVVAILDWELAFLGNPANDIAWQIYTHHFLGMGCEPLAGMPSDDERKVEYERVSGRSLAHWDYYWTVTTFKLHICLLLVYRESTPELETSRLHVRQYTTQRLIDAFERVKNSTF